MLQEMLVGESQDLLFGERRRIGRVSYAAGSPQQSGQRIA
jgi:hypothetical protein